MKRLRTGEEFLVRLAVLVVSWWAVAGWGESPASWPGFRGPNRDGKSPDTGLLKEWPPNGPPLLWRTSGIGAGYSSVAVSDGMVFTAGDINGRMVVSAFDVNGKRVWQTAHDAAWTKSKPGARSTPTIDSGRLYIVSGLGLIGCYDARTGRRLWSRHMNEFGGKPPSWGYAESPLVLANMVIVTPGGDRCIVALNKTTGRNVWATSGWRAEAQYGGNYAFVHQRVPMVLNGTREGLACIYPGDGRLLWYNTFSAHNTANCPTPVYANGRVFWANGYGKGGICLNIDVNGNQVKGVEAWRTRDMVCHHGGYIVHKGYIYGNHGNGWVCLELETGRKMWSARGVGKGSICYADGMLYLFGESGGRVGLATCTPDRFEMKGQFQVRGSGPSWAHPAVIGGRLYLRYADNLYCYDVRQH